MRAGCSTALTFVRRGPASHLFGAQVAVGPNSPVAKRAAEHVAQVLGPGEQSSIADRLGRVRATDLSVQSLHQLPHHTCGNSGTGRMEDEPEEDEVGQQYAPVWAESLD